MKKEKLSPRDARRPAEREGGEGAKWTEHRAVASSSESPAKSPKFSFPPGGSSRFSIKYCPFGSGVPQRVAQVVEERVTDTSFWLGGLF